MLRHADPPALVRCLSSHRQPLPGRERPDPSSGDCRLDSVKGRKIVAVLFAMVSFTPRDRELRPESTVETRWQHYALDPARAPFAAQGKPASSASGENQRRDASASVECPSLRLGNEDEREASARIRRPVPHSVLQWIRRYNRDEWQETVSPGLASALVSPVIVGWLGTLGRRVHRHSRRW